MKEVLSSILEHTKDRIRQPFLGAYSLSLMMYNWDVIYYLFWAKGDVEVKIVVLKQQYLSITDLTYPFFVALLVVYIPITINAYRQQLFESLEGRVENQRLTRKLKRSSFDLEVAENEARLKYVPTRIQKESEEEIDQIKNLNQSLNNEIENLNERIETLNELVRSQTNRLEELTERNEELTTRIRLHQINSTDYGVTKLNSQQADLLNSLSRFAGKVPSNKWKELENAAIACDEKTLKRLIRDIENTHTTAE
ncbi:TPA: hypothetical protein KD853_001953 [Vibrio parahaemolyticus]|uniref:Uncharacterized protein n=1 Tax=Vibrio antiquarius (strain Ex25) TaxID=150340 RepID=A0ACA6QR52_VIBAE|nr:MULTISPECIES: hypothetical protein [Vibrio harveyi group]ACY52826.1 hypothetical protein VEA_000138 [Vibrio antiquarius]ELB7596519.1 hypothetical protein [Vibrio parahaemolyticus]MBE4376705.1 hypothetical protein [Vibrio parahaemolyticus]MCQ9244250.1 hypothetical protein [Vibrio diabolicus]MCR9308989.1 hypothetical protein [Vibrio diabolicus]